MKSLMLFIFLMSPQSFVWAMSKEPKKTSQPQKTITKMGKATGYFNIAIEQVQEDDQTVTYKAQVLSMQTMTGSTFLWKIPDGALITEGEKQGAVDFNKGEVKEFTLHLSKGSLQPKDSLFFFVFKMKGGERHGASHSIVYGDKEVEKSGLRKKSQKPLKYYQ
jgi:hypothetical protein